MKWICRFFAWLWGAIEKAEQSVQIPPPQPSNGSLAHAKGANEVLALTLKQTQEANTELITLLRNEIARLQESNEKESRRRDRDIKEIFSQLKDCREMHERRDEADAKNARDWDQLVAHVEAEISKVKNFVKSTSENTGETIQGI